MKQRIAYFDRAKALLIGLVILGHVLNYANPGYDIIPYTLMQVVISSFHMPAFFLLTGMLAAEERWKKRSLPELLKSRCLTLLVPYFFFETLAVLYKHFVLHTVALWDGLYRMITFRCNVGADWYLPALFLANLFFWIYARCRWKYKWIPAVLLSIVLRQLLPNAHGWNLLLRGLLGFGFLVTGMLLKKQLTQFNLWKSVAAMGLTVLSAALAFKLGLGNDFYQCILESPLLFWISGVCGLHSVLAVARLLPWKWLGKVGENTLTIMGTHQLVQYTVPAGSSPLRVIGMLLLIAVVEIFVVAVTNRFCPFLVGKKRKETHHA